MLLRKKRDGMSICLRFIEAVLSVVIASSVATSAVEAKRKEERLHPIFQITTYPNLAPTDCTQYFFGSTSASIMMYNFQGGQNLANQDHNVCVRRETKNCRKCWKAETATTFSMSNITPADAALQSKCNTLNIIYENERICGKDDIAAQKTVGSVKVPFNIRFLSDGLEFTTEAF